MKTSNTLENTQAERNLYYYNPDYLGSTTLITNLDGEIVQNVAYIPFGEVFVEERNGSYSTSYLFNAKELDSETGLYYYGARYLDPTGAMWLSVDPLWEKYVGTTPYQYCAGNPVKLVDPDGRKFTDEAEKWAEDLEEKAKEKLSTEEENQKECQATLDEIKVLRESEQVYDVRTYSENADDNDVYLSGFVSYDQDKNQFVININTNRDDWQTQVQAGSQLATFAHELKHAYQFETGHLSFKINPIGGITKRPGFLYDLEDEKEAHKRGAAFDAPSVVPNSNVYPNLSKQESHIGKDNEKQYESSKTRKNGKDLLKDDIYHYRK